MFYEKSFESHRARIPGEGKGLTNSDRIVKCIHALAAATAIASCVARAFNGTLLHNSADGHGTAIRPPHIRPWTAIRLARRASRLASHEGRCVVGIWILDTLDTQCIPVWFGYTGYIFPT